MRKLIFLAIALVMLVTSVCAVPTTQAATLVGNNNATLNSVGSIGDLWYQYGKDPAYLNFWSDTIATPGAITITGGPGH